MRCAHKTRCSVPRRPAFRRASRAGGKFLRRYGRIQFRRIRRRRIHLESFPPARNRTGTLYYRGLGVRQDYVAARELFWKAAAHGVTQAQMFLGMIYYYGNGISPNNVPAPMWADVSHAPAHCELQKEKICNKNCGLPFFLLVLTQYWPSRSGWEWCPVIRSTDEFTGGNRTV